jgi:integrase
LRLKVDDLREVALPVPTIPAAVPVRLIPPSELPRIRPARPAHHLPAHFHSRFAASLQRFVELKRTLGRLYGRETLMLRHWDDYVYRHYPRATQVRAPLFHDWTQTLTGLTSTTSRDYQRVVGNFLRFHARDHAQTFIPDRLTFPKPAPVICPRLVTAAEMGRVLAMVDQLPPTADNPLRAETFRMGLILLFCCGLRCGELLRLKREDIQADHTVLQIRASKFHKSRWVPLSPTVTQALKQYWQQRSQEKLPVASETFLMGSRHHTPEVYAATHLSTMWHRLCVSAQVVNAQGYPPRLHDLRHSCALNVLQGWYAQGLDVQAKLPHLATFWGHVSIVSTHYYLKLTPELRPAASQRFHQRFAPLLDLGGAV